MNGNKLIILFIIFLFIHSVNSQDISYSINDPFITAYDYISNHNLHCYDDFAVFMADWGYAFLENNNGELQEVSRVYMQAFNTIARYGDNFFVCNSDFYESGSDLTIWQINLTNPYEPVVTEFYQFNDQPFITKLFVIDHYLYIMQIIENSYTRIDLNNTQNIQESSMALGNIFQAGDYLLFKQSSGYFSCYSDSGNGLELVFTDLDIENAHGNQNIYNIKLLSPSLAASANNRSIVLWDISNPAAWEMIDYWETPDGNTINTSGDIALYNDLYVNSGYHLYQIELADDNTISNTNVFDFPAIFLYKTIGNIENLLIIPTSHGLVQYDISSEPEFLGFYHQWCSLGNPNIVNNNFFIYSFSGCLNEGIYHADISNPCSPVFQPNLLTDAGYDVMRVSESYFYLSNCEECYWDIYRYQEGALQFLENQPYSNLFSYYNNIKTDVNEPDAFYITNSQICSIQKYVVYDNDPELLMDESIPCQKCGFVKNGLGYFITDNTDSQGIYIYSGLDQNMIIEENSYPDLFGGVDYWITYLSDNYMSIHNSCNIYIAEYEGEELTNQIFSLNPPYLLPGCMIENYLFAVDSNVLYIFEINENSSGILSPISEIRLCHRIYRVNKYQNNNTDYIFCNSAAAVSVIEIEITNSGIECSIIDTPHDVAAFPNPVSFTNDSEITFELTNSSFRNLDDCTIKLYNMKGQIISKHNLTRSNGKLSLNTASLIPYNIPSGIYMYRIENSRSSAEGKIMLTK